MDEFYFEYLKCWNCGTEDSCNIPKGETIEDFNDKTMCSNCGCHRRLK